jgi:pimeloyl-ACP methyl ester carboxylesterase
VTRRRALWLAAALLAAGLLLCPEAPPAPTGAWLRTLGLEPRFQTVDGLRIRYLRTGAGPHLILLHGFGSSIYTWQDVIPDLSRDHDVVALDLPGFGASDQPPDLAFGRLPRSVLGLMDALGIPRAILVGNSLGGATAVGVTLGHPERVEKLVLVDSAGYNLAAGDRPFFVRLAGSPAGPLLERLPLRRFLVRRALRQVFHDEGLVSPERVEEYLAPIARPGALASLRSLNASGTDLAASFADRIRDVSVPTLIVWGREDRWIPLEQGRRFEAAIRGSRLVVIPECGHMPQEERPAELLATVRPFLAAAESRLAVQ